jgi:hypothetical protein
MLDSPTRALLGRRGQEYVERHYTWQRGEAVYRGVVEQLAARRA